jgi:hypothetical protein
MIKTGVQSRLQATNASFIFRHIDLTNRTHIKFEDGQEYSAYNSSLQYDNKYCVPVEIYGVKI